MSRPAVATVSLLAAALIASAQVRAQDHSRHDHHAMPPAAAAPATTANATEPLTPIPVLTDADRAAAFPALAGGMEHASGVHSFVLIDRLELWDTRPGTGLGWEAEAWMGSDLNRLWLHADGERSDGVTEESALEVLYGRSVAAWWDVVAGIRHDFRPGASRNWAALGIKGLMPWQFEASAMLYAAESGHFAASVEVEYDLLLTNRLILQPQLGLAWRSKDDPQRGVASGLQHFEAGARLRYEFSRRFAPYVGLVYTRALGDSADLLAGEGEDESDTSVVAGLRIWF